MGELLDGQSQQKPDVLLSNEERKVSHKRRKHKEHITVQHNYHDHALDVETPGDFLGELRGGASAPFPIKLHEMLERVEADGNAHIVSWQPHGRCFVVHKPDLFRVILPQYFKLSKIASFQRQLNLYGFQRLTRGLDKGGYYHEMFLRGKAFLSPRIMRVKVKGTGVRARSNPEQEPDLWTLIWMTTSGPTRPQFHHSASSVVSDDSDADSSGFSAEPAEPFSMECTEVDNDILHSWGKTFHYLDTSDPSVMAQVTDSTAVMPKPELELSAQLAAMDHLLDTVDFDELVHEIFDSDDLTFADLLERAVA